MFCGSRSLGSKHRRSRFPPRRSAGKPDDTLSGAYRFQHATGIGYQPGPNTSAIPGQLQRWRPGPSYRRRCCSDCLKSRYQVTGPLWDDISLIKLQVAWAATRSAQARSSPARRSGCFVQGSDDHMASSSNQERHGTWLPSVRHSSWRTAREWPSGYELPEPPPLRCPRPDECPSAPDRVGNFSQIDCLIRGHGKTNHGVSRRFEVSLSAQGDNRFVFDYENSHDMMGPIWLAGDILPKEA